MAPKPPRWLPAVGVCLGLLLVPLVALLWLPDPAPRSPALPPLPPAAPQAAADDDGAHAVSAPTAAARTAPEQPEVEEEAEGAVAPVEPGSLAGVVVDERGSPLVSYTLAVESFRPADGGRVGTRRRRSKVQDDGGRFELTGLPIGRYVLIAVAEGRPPARSDSISVASGENVRGVRIRVDRGGVLEGTVSDAASSEAVVGARIQLDSVSHGGAPPAATESDAAGHYRLEGVPEEPFSIRVQAAGYKTQILSAIVSRSGSSTTKDVTLNVRKEGEAATEYAGVGAALAFTSHGVVFRQVFEGGPASAAGIQPADLIVRIDGRDVRDWTMPQVVQQLRGEAGSRVSITVEREGAGEVEVTIRREQLAR